MFSVNRKLHETLKIAWHRLFVLGQQFGWDVLPRHFYSSIPDIGELRRTASWRRASTMVGVGGADLDAQIRFVRECCSESRQERLRRGGIYEQACRENGDAGYGAVESDVLFCFITAKRPRRIVQIGCGVSTAVMLLAAQEAGYQPDLLCVEPFPTRYLVAAAERRWITLVREKAQNVELRTLTNLTAGDFLFVDSTHAVRPGGEVNRLILEVLPRLRAGVFAHFHDIYFPYDYPMSVLNTLFFPEESTLLHAFLINNSRWSIAASLSMLHHARPDELKSLLPNYRPAAMQDGLLGEPDSPGHFPSSVYLCAT